jgi:hypothetical protein
MATIDDCYNQLVEANGELSEIDNGVQSVNSSVQTVAADVEATTTAVQTGFGQLYTIANYTNQLLRYQIEQNVTIICYLEKIARQTCGLVNEGVLQTAAQLAMRRDLDDLRQLYELANPAAAVEQHRLEKLKAQVENCCPPKVPKPPCTFEPCPMPRELPQNPLLGPVQNPKRRPSGTESEAGATT